MKRVILTVLFSVSIVVLVFLFHRPEQTFDMGARKNLVVYDGDFSFSVLRVQASTVGEALEYAGFYVEEGDSVFPVVETTLFSGTVVRITRAHHITVAVDGETRLLVTQATQVESALAESGIVLDEDDIVKPGREAFVSDQMKVIVTRVVIREETKEIAIPFETRVTEDATLSWRKKVTTQKGEKGIKMTAYRIAYHDDKEVSRRVLKTDVTKAPVAEVVTHGTRVETGKSHRGIASWYAFTGTLSAANPWLPIGSYVRVTNMENGKTVIVRINDRGPFAPGRIIDLDKVAFAKIASIGAGVINVKMEEITN